MTLQLKAIRAVLLDLDGVMYRGNELCRGAAEFVAFLRKHGIPPFYLSNNSRSASDVVAGKLSSLGVPTASSEVITSAELLAEKMGRRKMKGRAAIIGSEWLSTAIARSGWEIADSRVDCLVVGLDHQLTYSKLQMGVDALARGAEFIAANRDPVNPIAGTLEPGCGAIVAALEAATDRRARCVGKPNLMMLNRALGRLGLSAAETLMVGDSLASDMPMARRGGVHSALVLSGQTNQRMVDRLPARLCPELVLDDLAALHQRWLSSEP